MAQLDATLRNLGMDFQDLMGLPVEDRRVQLLARLQDVYNLAVSRQSLGKAGPFASPDCSAATKVVEVVARLAGVSEDVALPGGKRDDVKPSVTAISKAADALETKRREKAA